MRNRIGLLIVTLIPPLLACPAAKQVDLCPGCIQDALVQADDGPGADATGPADPGPDGGTDAGDGTDPGDDVAPGGPKIGFGPAGELDFGCAAVGVPVQRAVTILNVGTVDLVIPAGGIGFSADADPGLALADPPAGEVRVPAAGSVLLFIKWNPAAATPVAKGPRGSLRVVSNAPTSPDLLPITAGVCEASCAVCEFRMEVGGGIVLSDGDTLDLPDVSAGVQLTDLSYTPTVGASIVQRTWSVAAPSGSTVAIAPSPADALVGFVPDRLGDYTVSLEVWPSAGCAATCAKTLHVQPSEGCRVELTWVSDPAEESGKSAFDLDLHAVHPFASGSVLDADGQPYGYFDSTYDCYWMNAHPIWDPVHAADAEYQPALTRDATEGPGPEVWHYPRADERCTRIGVHAFAVATGADGSHPDRAVPTVRILWNGTLKYQRTLSPGLALFALWDVGRICCADGQFTEFQDPQGEPVVVPNYPAPAL